MKTCWAVVLALLFAACSSPVPPRTAVPLSSPSVAETATPAPSASAAPTPSPAPTPQITCLPEPRPVPSVLAGDPCPAALAAVEARATLGYPITRIYLAPDPFLCGDLWPGVGTPPVCFGPLILPGTTRHGWVAFAGTAKVAAVALNRSLPVPSLVNGTPSPWQATLAAFTVPPAGWVWPS